MTEQDERLNKVEVPHDLGLEAIYDAEETAHALALHIARCAVEDHLLGKLEEVEFDTGIELCDDEGRIMVEWFYTEAELDQMAKDTVEIYDNDDTRAQCWLYALDASVEKGLKQIKRPLGTKLKIPA
jgi:hypothetical protein